MWVGLSETHRFELALSCKPLARFFLNATSVEVRVASVGLPFCFRCASVMQTRCLHLLYEFMSFGFVCS